jgi:hypothetical protein
MIRSFFVLLPAIALAAACGSSGSNSTGNKLDCAWVNSSNNCWKNVALAAKTCVPGNEIGTFSADRMSCTFGSGATVTFDSAVPTTPSSTAFYGLTIKDATGAACLRITEPNATDTQLTTSAGTVTVSASSSSFSETCPNGAVYSTSDSLGVGACGADAGGALATSPGESVLAGTGIMVVTVIGTGDPSGLKLFGCR